MRILLALLLVFFSLPVLAQTGEDVVKEGHAAEEAEHIRPGQAMAPPPVAPTAPAAYRGEGVVVKNAFLEEGDNCVSMQLHSRAQGMDAIVAASTPLATSVALIDQHDHRDVEKFELWPDTPRELKRGVACLILRGVKVPPKAGEKFTLALRFARAPAQNVEIVVRGPEKPPEKPAESAPEKGDGKAPTPAKMDGAKGH